MLVYKAINAVQAELAKEGIAKDRTNTQGNTSYKFRGIDDIYNAISPLLARNNLCILPRMIKRECAERTSAKGNALFYVTVEAEFDFVSAEDASRHTVRTFGEAMDSGDKATNKAMSAAYKYAAFQTFAIPTEGDNDADATDHAIAPKATPKGSAMDTCRDAYDAMSPDQQLFLSETASEVIAAFGNMSDSEQKAGYSMLVSKLLDNEEKTAIWWMFDSKIRSSIKRQMKEDQK